MADPDSPFAKIAAEILAKPVKPPDRNEQHRAEIALKQRVEALRISLGPRYAECSLDNWQVSQDPTERNAQQAVLGLIQAFADDLPEVIKHGSGLFLYGPVGSGKDHLLSALMLAAARNGRSVSWLNGLDIYAAARDAITESTAESVVFDRLTRPTVLGLSDPLPPSKELTTSQAALLLRAFDHRYRQRKPTWVTVNIATRAEAEARLGVQLFDRLTDGALCLYCNWPSFRTTRRWTPRSPFELETP